MIRHLFDRPTMSCREFAQRLVDDGWIVESRRGPLVTLRYKDLTQTVDLRADTGFIDPNGDGTNIEWTPTPGGTHYTTVDGGTRQPTTPSAGELADYVSETLHGDRDEYDYTTITVDPTAGWTSVTVWTYGRYTEGGGAPTLHIGGNIYVGAAWQTEGDFGHLNGSDSWKSLTWSGTWTQADLDAFQTRLRIDDIEGGTGKIYEMYAAITYTPPAATGQLILVMGDD